MANQYIRIVISCTKFKMIKYSIILSYEFMMRFHNASYETHLTFASKRKVFFIIWYVISICLLERSVKDQSVYVL